MFSEEEYLLRILIKMYFYFSYIKLIDAKEHLKNVESAKIDSLGNIKSIP